MKLSAKTQVCTIIGDPIEHSLSPAMHNAAYKALGIDDTFVFTASHVTSENLETAIRGARALNFHGITVTIPHKIDVMKFLDEIDPVAQTIGAVNTILNKDGILVGYNTDWLGVKTSIEKTVGAIVGKKAAVIGAGGAARAVVYGLQQCGAKVTVFNRTLEAAKELAHDFRCNAASLSTIEQVKGMDIILNATSLGMGNQNEISPVPKQLLQQHHIIFDAVYIPYETKLLREAAEVGATIIHGLDMLLYQGTAQFSIYTGVDAPEQIMKQVLLDHAHKYS